MTDLAAPPVEATGLTLAYDRHVVTAELVGDVFGLRCRVVPDPETGTPLVVPAARQPTAAPAVARRA